MHNCISIAILQAACCCLWGSQIPQVIWVLPTLNGWMVHAWVCTCLSNFCLPFSICFLLLPVFPSFPLDLIHSLLALLCFSSSCFTGFPDTPGLSQPFPTNYFLHNFYSSSNKYHTMHTCKIIYWVQINCKYKLYKLFWFAPGGSGKMSTYEILWWLRVDWHALHHKT